MTESERYMAQCLKIAEKGLGSVSPNPMVGAVIVHDGRVIGEGYHASYGGPHAEVNAIDSVKDADKHLLSSSTIYVNLEPCAHFGKTPPCADLIVKMGIPHVVFSSDDPNPLVAGKGAQKLRDAGITMKTGVLKKEADFLNRRFFRAMVSHRPYIILKWAESEDGFMAPLDAKQLWLTGEDSRVLVHTWRGQEDAIVAGTRTIEIDDPELTVRLVEGRDPMRVIIDRELTLAHTHKVFREGAPVLVFNEREETATGNIHYIKIDFEGGVLAQVLNNLYTRKIRSLIVEGGPETLEGFVKAGLWDEARIFTALVTMGEGKAGPKIIGTLLKKETIGKDGLSIYLHE